MSEQTNISFPNVSNIKIAISGVEIFPRSKNYQNETIAFSNLTIEEDMFAESVFGSIEYMDSTPNLQLTNGIKIDDDIYLGFDDKTYKFKIVDINITTDLASKKIIGPNSVPTKIIVRFASESFVTANYNFSLTQDFFGTISKESNVPGETSSLLRPQPRYLPNINLPLSDTIFQRGSYGDDVENQFNGFLQEKIAPILNKPLKADPTFNHIWLKHEPSFYPYSKLGNTARFSQIMNYICEYACDAFNENAVNFFFWEDLDKWNFRSIESILRNDYITIADKDLPQYTPSIDENNLGAIVSLEVINAITPIKLKNAGAFSSEYIRIKPDWKSVYSHALDTNGNLIKTRIEYNYAKDGANWLKIASNPVSPAISGLSGTVGDANNGPTGPSISYISSSNLRISDTNYGYYTNPYYQENVPWWNYYDNYNSYTEDVSEKNEPDRMESRFWQSQFDFCELPGDYLSIIYNKIKWNPNRLKWLKKYASLKRLKNKWDIYKKNICCERQQPETFFALLTKAEKIYGGHGQTLAGNTAATDGLSGPIKIAADAGGIWAYEWTEVEFWPRSEVSKVPAKTADQDWSDYSIIEFEDNSFPFVFLKPAGYLEGMASAGLGFPDTRAYNLNEILNSRIPQEFEKKLSDGSEYAPYTLVMNPGVTDTLGFTGSRTEKSEFSSYPTNYKMMPVGKFRVVKGDCPPNWDDDGNAPNGYFYQAGRIVQMFRIPRETLTSIRGATVVYDYATFFASESANLNDAKKDPVKNLYVFDIENAHDGLCVDC